MEEEEMSSQLNKYKARSKGGKRRVQPPKVKTREVGRKWDGTSRPVTDDYRKNWNDIFKKEKEEQDEHGWSADVEFDQAR
jgi:hypothetical protein